MNNRWKIQSHNACIMCFHVKIFLYVRPYFFHMDLG
jgi:hypothetical protein